MTRLPPPRRPVLRALAGVAAVGVLAASGTGYAAAMRYDNKIERVQVFAGLDEESRPHAAQPVEAVDLEPMNVLIVGIDNREGLTREQKAQWHLGSADYGNQTDTIMLVHIGRDAKYVSVVSLPRDSLVEIPAYKDADGVEHDSQMNKINAAFTLGGAALTVRTVEKATGVKIDHYVGVSLGGFIGMVDAVDGVDVCLSQPVKDDPKYTSLDLPAGKSTLRGGMALSFVRARHVGTDFSRMKRQQQFMASLLKKATSLGIVTNPLRLDAFVSAASESLQVDETLDRKEILNLARKLSGISLDKIEFARLPIADDNAVNPDNGNSGNITWVESGARRIFQSMVDDKPLAVGKTKSTTTKPKGPVATVEPSEISVRVINGSGVAGLAKTAAAQLEAAGFVIDEDPTSVDGAATGTVVRYDSEYTESVNTLKQAFPGAKFIPVDGFGSTFEVTVGSSFTKVVTPVISAAGGGLDPNANLDTISEDTAPLIASDTVC